MNLNEISKVTFESSSPELIKGFNWAKGQALEYIHFNDPVGNWYDAALPNREAFCMRDIFHQCNGAQVLGLKDFNKNMLKKFAENISDKRDYCTYWEINRYDNPAPVDYKNDEDFWYNLPSNFDMIDCCLRQYLWTGDKDYIEDPIFLNFYEKSVKEYVEAWDLNKDGFVEHKGSCARRGIPSYMEGDVGVRELKAGSDLIGATFAGYRAYARIQELRGNHVESDLYMKKAEEVKKCFNSEWWSTEIDNYLTLSYENGEKIGTSINDVESKFRLVTSLPLYFNVTEEGYKTDIALDTLVAASKVNVETKSHFPEVLYRYGRNKDALRLLKELMSEDLLRREYPEVSYSTVGAVVTGLMGLSFDSVNNQIETLPRVEDDIEWVSIKHVPVFNGEISINYMSNDKVEIINNTGKLVIWKATFKGEFKNIKINNEYIMCEHELRKDKNTYSYVLKEIKSNETCTCCI